MHNIGRWRPETNWIVGLLLLYFTSGLLSKGIQRSEISWSIVNSWFWFDEGVRYDVGSGQVWSAEHDDKFISWLQNEMVGIQIKLYQSYYHATTSSRELTVWPHISSFVRLFLTLSFTSHYRYMNRGYHAEGVATMNVYHNQQGTSGSFLVNWPYLPYLDKLSL